MKMRLRAEYVPHLSSIGLIPIVVQAIPAAQFLPTSSESLEQDDTSLTELTVHLFSLTITDEGPDPHTTVSKLWNFHANFQEASSSGCVVAGDLNPVSPTDIAVEQ